VSITQGAASAAPNLDALAEEIHEELAAIDEDNLSALGHAIRAGELLAEVKAELAHGEFLPWLEWQKIPRSTAHLYMQLAANVQRVRHLPSIREARRAISGKKKGGSKKPKTRGVATDTNVIDWAAARRAEGMGRDEIVTASRTREDYPGATVLSNGTMGTIDAVLHDRQAFGRTEPPPTRKGPTESGKRKRKLYEEIREEGESKLRRLRVDIADATMKLEHMVLPADIGMTEESQENITALYSDLTILFRWTEHALAACSANMDDLHQRETIEKLRTLAQNGGASDNERRVASLMADRLEAKRLALSP